MVVTGTGTARTLYLDGFPAMTETAGPESTRARWSHSRRTRGSANRGSRPIPASTARSTSSASTTACSRNPKISQLAWPQHDYSDWRFDDATGTTATDSSDNAITGVLANGITWDTAGRLGGAIAFPGGAAGATGPTVTLAANPLANCTDQLTIATWIKLNDTTTVWQHIFNFGASNGSAFINMVPTDGTGMHFAMVSPAGALRPRAARRRRSPTTTGTTSRSR